MRHILTHAAKAAAVATTLLTTPAHADGTTLSQDTLKTIFTFQADPNVNPGLNQAQCGLKALLEQSGLGAKLRKATQEEALQAMLAVTTEQKKEISDLCAKRVGYLGPKGGKTL